MAESKTISETSNAKTEVTLEQIKFTEKNKTMAILSCIPIVGLIMFFVEKEDNFVRYIGAQFVLLSLVFMLLSIVPVVNCIGWLTFLVIMIVGMVKTSNSERFDLPVLSDLAVKLMNAM